MAPSDDRPLQGEGEPTPGDEPRDRIADLRKSIARRLREVADETEKRQMEEHAATLSEVEERAHERLEAMLAVYAERLDQDLAKAAQKAQTEIVEAARSAALALVEERTASARKALAKQNEAAVDAALLSVNEQTLREVKRRGAKLEKRMRSEIGERLVAAEERLWRSASRDQAALAAELRDEIDSLVSAASEHHSEIGAALQAQVAEGLEGATERISREARTELARGLAAAERTLDEQASSRMASHTSRLIEQAAKQSAALGERAAELAAGGQAAAAEIARGVAGSESERMYRDLAVRLEARIETAEEASAAESARVRAELENVNEEAARARLDEALERVRSEGATQFGALKALAQDLEGREQRRELRLAKAETSRRVKRALSKLERERSRIDAAREDAVSAARADLELATEAAKGRIDEHAEQAGRSVAGGGERLADALRRAEETVAQIEESTGRISELERRARTAEREAARSAEMARNAVVLEARMREALSMEAAAAEQIAIAERRLIDFVVTR